MQDARGTGYRRMSSNPTSSNVVRSDANRRMSEVTTSGEQRTVTFERKESQEAAKPLPPPPKVG